MYWQCKRYHDTRGQSLVAILFVIELVDKRFDNLVLPRGLPYMILYEMGFKEPQTSIVPSGYYIRRQRLIPVCIKALAFSV